MGWLCLECASIYPRAPPQRGVPGSIVARLVFEHQLDWFGTTSLLYDYFSMAMSLLERFSIKAIYFIYPSVFTNSMIYLHWLYTGVFRFVLSKYSDS